MHRKPYLSFSKRTATFTFILSILFAVIGGVATPIEWQARQTAVSTLNGQLIPFPINPSKPFGLYLSGGFPFPVSAEDMKNGFNFTSYFPELNLSYNLFTINFKGNKYPKTHQNLTVYAKALKC